LHPQEQSPDKFLNFAAQSSDQSSHSEWWLRLELSDLTASVKLIWQGGLIPNNELTFQIGMTDEQKAMGQMMRK
jgi:hypothetical protein